jgi:hypothetical protein
VAQTKPTQPANGGQRGDGETALRADIVAILNELNGNLDNTNMAAAFAAGPVEPAFSTWKDLQLVQGILTSGSTAGAVNLCELGPASAVASIVGANGSWTRARQMTPPDYLAGARTTRFKMRWVCAVNGTAPGTNVIPGVYPVSSMGAPAAATPSISAVGTVVTGSTASFLTPALGSLTTTESTEFTLAATQHYCFIVNLGGALAVNSQVVITGILQMRQT